MKVHEFLLRKVGHHHHLPLPPSPTSKKDIPKTWDSAETKMSDDKNYTRTTEFLMFNLLAPELFFKF